MRDVVLIADPDPAVCSLYRTALQANGFETDDVRDGRDALAKAFALHPSALVLAADLEFIDGYELCRLVRGDGRTAGIRVVFLTETAEPDDVLRAGDAGADAVVDRTAALESLSEAVRRALTRARSQPSVRASGRTPPAQGKRRSMLVRAHDRFATTQPPLAPPSLFCPACQTRLVYQHSHIGGVSARHEEQWDYFVCAVCGGFEYRQRTRNLRPTGRA